MTKKIHQFYLYTFPILLILILLAACVETPPEVITFTDVMQFKDGTRVKITGYLDLHGSYKTDLVSYSSCVRLRDVTDEHDVSVWIRHRDYGKDSEPNRMEPLGPLYDGTQVGFGERVTITGTLWFTDDGYPYINKVTKIE
jgi:hypothetical protein